MPLKSAPQTKPSKSLPLNNFEYPFCVIKQKSKAYVSTSRKFINGEESGGDILKRNGILNSDISRILSYMGHTDRICIGDCGLPIPDGVERIDLTVRFGQPAFMDVLKEIGLDMKFEKVILAKEIKEQNPKVLSEVEVFLVKQRTEPEIEFVSHVEFKNLTKKCKAVIRTGETTPYANIILQSGCIF